MLYKAAVGELADPMGVARAELAVEDAQKVGHVLECNHLQRRCHCNPCKDTIERIFGLIWIAIHVEPRVLRADWGDSQHVYA